MRREEDRLAEAAELEQQIADLDAGARIEIARRLVEDEHLRIVEQDARELEALLHALRHGGDEAVLELAEIGQLEDRVDHPERGHAERVGEELEVLADGDAVVDAGVVGHVADGAAHRLGIDRDVDAIDLDAPGHGLEQRRHDADGRGLAGAVGADEAEDLARPHVEGDVAEDVEVAEAVPEVAHADRRRGVRRGRDGRRADPRGRHRGRSGRAHLDGRGHGLPP